MKNHLTVEISRDNKINWTELAVETPGDFSPKAGTSIKDLITFASKAGWSLRSTLPRSEGKALLFFTKPAPFHLNLFELSYDSAIDRHSFTQNYLITNALNEVVGTCRVNFMYPGVFYIQLVERDKLEDFDNTIWFATSHASLQPSLSQTAYPLKNFEQAVFTTDRLALVASVEEVSFKDAEHSIVDRLRLKLELTVGKQPDRPSGYRTR